MKILIQKDHGLFTKFNSTFKGKEFAFEARKMKEHLELLVV
jgi:hypothetical protein